jgi:hypothetical protein
MIKPHLKFLFAVPTGWLLKSLEVSILAFCLVIGMYDPVPGKQPGISTYIEPESLTVGDKFLFINKVESVEDYKIEPAPIEEQIGDAAVLSDIFKMQDPEPGTIAYACTLAVFRPGDAEIPSFVFNITDSLGNTESVIGKSVRTTIGSVLPADTTDLEIADIKEPMRLRGPIWPYLIIPLVILVIVSSIFILRKYFRKKMDIPDLPPRPPWEVAYEKLDHLKAERHIEFGRLKRYYFDLSLIVREYIEGRYEFPAAEYTTYELENTEKLREIDSDLYKQLFDFFYRADLAKFAKFLPAAENAESDMKFVYDFISRTIPVLEGEDVTKGKLEEAVK